MQLEQFLRDHPKLKPVEGDQEEAVIKWAASQKYIRLVKFGGRHWYSEQDYDTAVMWAEKMSWNGDGKLGR